MYLGVGLYHYKLLSEQLLLYTTDFFFMVFSRFHCLQAFFISSDFFNHTWVVYRKLLILHIFLFLEHTVSLPIAVSLEKLTCINRDREWKLRERS